MANVIEHRGGGWYSLPGGRKVRGRAKAVASMVGSSSAGPTLTGRLKMLRQAGLLYKGLRDIYTTAGYIEEGKENFDNYWGLYERDPVAGRVVDMPPKTTWRTPPEVFEGEDQDKATATAFEAAWTDLVKRLKLWRQLERVDRLARVGRYAVLLLGVKGPTDQELKEPMERMVGGTKDLLYLACYAEKFAAIKTWEVDQKNPRFGLPLTYEINLSSGITAFKDKKVLVHASRIIHVAEDPLTDEVYGRPALKRILNPLSDLLKVTASTGEAYWQLAARILTGSIDPAVTEIKEGQMDSMGEALEEMVHDLRRQFVGQGVDLKWLTGEPPKASDALDVYKAMIAVGSGIAARILFGSEQGQLASSQDERAYFGMINERQEHHAEPMILRPFIDRLVEADGLPKPGVDGYNVVWPALFELSDKEIAEANLTRAKSAKELTPMGGDPRELVEVDEERNVWLVPALPQEPEEEEEEEELSEEEEEVVIQARLLRLVENQTKIQTLIFPKAHWASKEAAVTWARTHDFKTGVDTTSTSYRLRQRPPGAFKRLRTICLRGAKRPTNAACNIKAVVGPLKKKK